MGIIEFVNKDMSSLKIIIMQNTKKTWSPLLSKSKEDYCKSKQRIRSKKSIAISLCIVAIILNFISFIFYMLNYNSIAEIIKYIIYVITIPLAIVFLQAIKIKRIIAHHPGKI